MIQTRETNYISHLNFFYVINFLIVLCFNEHETRLYYLLSSLVNSI